MKAKFKRQRSQLLSDETVLCMKAKCGCTDVSERKRKLTVLTEEITNVKVPRFKLSEVDLTLVGEDQRSIQKNVAAIVAECRKANPDKSILADRLKCTIYLHS